MDNVVQFHFASIVAIVIAAFAFGALLVGWYMTATNEAPQEHAGQWFADRIRQMNHMYKLPVYNAPTLGNQTQLADRLRKFRATLMDEVDEVLPVIEGPFSMDREALLVFLADWFGDLTVYIRSEALKYGIPLEDVVDIIMDSNESKLGADGQPIYDSNGKFLKGPNYWRPEPQIAALLKAGGAS